MPRKSSPKRKVPRPPKLSGTRPLPAAPTPQVVFDWSRIAAAENHLAFERMAGDLVALEFDSNLFSPNATRSGKDGGADGFYNGVISGAPGPWKIAAATRKNLSALKKKVRDENRLAVTKGFRGLLFITPFDATATDVKELSTIASKGLKKGIVWARGKLDQLLRKHPWVATYYLGYQVIPGFVPVDHPGERDISSQPDIPLIGRAQECVDVEVFLASAKRIVVLVAPGGSGNPALISALFPKHFPPTNAG